jgi:MarR-like DNA-binding transcriptional regulator SgrR of sgrS sRNA
MRRRASSIGTQKRTLRRRLRVVTASTRPSLADASLAHRSDPQIYDTLVRMDEHFRLQPELADRWEY